MAHPTLANRTSHRPPRIPPLAQEMQGPLARQTATRGGLNGSQIKILYENFANVRNLT
jgi:hypothetical protein